MVYWWAWVNKNTWSIAFVSPSQIAHKVQITVRNARLPTWHRGSVSDWFAGTRTRSSCCGSSSALVGHGFWPQIERNLGVEKRVLDLVLFLQRVRNAAHLRQPSALLLVPLPGNRKVHNEEQWTLSIHFFVLFTCRHSQGGKNKPVTSPKIARKYIAIPICEKSMEGGGCGYSGQHKGSCGGGHRYLHTWSNDIELTETPHTHQTEKIEISLMNYVTINILVVIICYSFTKMLSLEKLNKRYMGSTCIISYIWITCESIIISK